MSLGTLCRRADRACQRRLSRWLGRRPCRVQPEQPIVSFTFDDFPRSAMSNGATILERHGLVGTYYVSLGLAGRTSATGPAFELADLATLLAHGHELGCHTYSHCPAWETAPAAYEAAIRRNADMLQQCHPELRFRTHSYPISHPRPETKRIASRHFGCCRAGGQTFNLGNVDLNHLSAFFLEQSRDNIDAITHLLEDNARQRGWLILATHDIDDSPTRYGCTPAFFTRIVRSVLDSGARVMPVGAALAVLTANTCSSRPTQLWRNGR